MRTYLVVCAISALLAFGLWRFMQTARGEWGFGGLIVVIPFYVLVATVIYTAVRAAMAYGVGWMSAPPDDGAPHVPDPEAVAQLRAHGALPPEK